tara:strand:- start:14289 stop:15692 length:1404 start_codon:yes stop_codon:yes gene_type:complete
LNIIKYFYIIFLVWCASCTPHNLIFDNQGSWFLVRKINNLIADSGLEANMSIKIVALETGRTLYGLNSKKLLMPASNNKLYTCGAALQILGSDYQFKTSIVQQNNNLFIKGGGDPNLSIEQLDSLARIIGEKITFIDTLFVDANMFDTLNYGNGWMWDEGSNRYSAPISALNINSNCIDFIVKPGQTGENAFTEIYPKTSYINIKNISKTVQDTNNFKKLRIDRDWSGRTNYFTISGEILDTASIDTFQRNIFDPVKYVGTVFKEQLENYNVQVNQIIKGHIYSENSIELALHNSITLKDLINNLMHESDNLAAESIIKTIGKSDSVAGNWKDGLRLTKKYLFDFTGLDTSDLRIVDGSGMSRYNLTSSEHITDFLSSIYFSKNKDLFLSSLPNGGSSKSTIEKRMEHLGSNIKAKTGHLSGVSNLSGFIFSEKNGTIAFSILMNGFIGSPKAYHRLQEAIIQQFYL